jgi:hypothetical protein
MVLACLGLSREIIPQIANCNRAYTDRNQGRRKNNHHDNGSVVVITTARPESYRLFTKQELDTIGVRYSQLIMEMGRGTRVILNDVDPENPELPRAIGINLERDGGLKDIEIPSYISPYESN